MSSIEELRRKRMELNNEERKIFNNMNSIINESVRVSKVAHNSKKVIADFENEFERQTGLDKVDISFLFFAIGLQCIRQYFICNDKFRFDKASDGDKFMEKLVPKRYEDILLQSVPYDAFNKLDGFEESTGISGANHRYTTLGHDPLLGWIFGTLNILTDSLTKNSMDLESYRVINSRYISSRVSIVNLIEQGTNYASQDYKLLIVSVLRQAIHFGADAFTKMGLPIPIINSISPNLSSKLLSKECRIDIYSVSRSAMLATLINSIIAAIHSIFYDEKKYFNRDVYEVKTRKILSYSNFIATASNAVYCGITKDFTKLDIGGMLVTVYRLICDSNFIREVKEEFVFGGFNELIQGKEYNFEGV